MFIKYYRKMSDVDI